MGKTDKHFCIFCEFAKKKHETPASEKKNKQVYFVLRPIFCNFAITKHKNDERN